MAVAGLLSFAGDLQPTPQPADQEYPAAGAAAMGARRIVTRKDDPSQIAARNTDWAEFMTMLDGRQQYIVKATAEGESYSGQAAQLKISPSAITQRRQTIARRARQFWGESVIADAQVLPLWRREAEQR
jgi:hypothetical protein